MVNLLTIWLPRPGFCRLFVVMWTFALSSMWNLMSTRRRHTRDTEIEFPCEDVDYRVAFFLHHLDLLLLFLCVLSGHLVGASVGRPMRVQSTLSAGLSVSLPL